MARFSNVEGTSRASDMFSASLLVFLPVVFSNEACGSGANTSLLFSAPEKLISWITNAVTYDPSMPAVRANHFMEDTSA